MYFHHHDFGFGSLFGGLGGYVDVGAGTVVGLFLSVAAIGIVEALALHFAPYDTLTHDKLEVAAQREEHDEGVVEEGLEQGGEHESQIAPAAHAGLQIVVIDDDKRELEAEDIHHQEDYPGCVPVDAAREGEVEERAETYQLDDGGDKFEDVK